MEVFGGISVTISLLGTLSLVTLVVLAVLGGVATYLRWRFTHYVITTQELYYRSGIITKSVIQVRLANIQNTRYSRSILERIFGYGDISIQTSGTDSTELLIENVPNPQDINRIFTRQRSHIAADSSER